MAIFLDLGEKITSSLSVSVAGLSLLLIMVLLLLPFCCWMFFFLVALKFYAPVTSAPENMDEELISWKVSVFILLMNLVAEVEDSKKREEGKKKTLQAARAAL